MKKYYSKLIVASATLVLSFSSHTAHAQIPVVGLLSGIIKKVITAIDLKVQQLQNKTIALQNAEQDIINHLSLGQLSDISGWLNKERNLYQDYYKELATVKTVISDYDQVRAAIRNQADLVREYHSASRIFHSDPHFSAAELAYMETVYAGILEESLRNLDRLELAVEAFATQMDDAERLAAIHQAASGIQMNLNHLRQFSSQAASLSVRRGRDEQDRASLKALYGIQ
jgi:hypothetical protein